MEQQRYCRNCVQWQPVRPWQGRCKLFPKRKPRWDDSARPEDTECPHYTDKGYVPGIYQNGQLIQKF